MKIGLELHELIKKDEFTKYYVFAVGIAILVDWLMMPLFTKFMGIYAPLTLISIYYIVSEFAGYIEYYFENTKIHKVFFVLILSDFIQLIAMFTYFINIEYFTYLMMVIFSFQALLYEIYNIKSMQFIEKYSDINVSKFQSFLLFNKTNMVVIALLISLIYFLITDNYDYLIGFIILISFLNLINEIKLFSYVKKIEKT